MLTNEIALAGNKKSWEVTGVPTRTYIFYIVIDRSDREHKCVLKFLTTTKLQLTIRM